MASTNAKAAPTFLENVSTIWAHTDEPPFTATFEHTLPGPAQGVRSECLWYPPRIPAPVLTSGLGLNLELDSSTLSDSESAVIVDREPDYDAPSQLGQGSGLGFSSSTTLFKRKEEDGLGACILLFIPGNPGIVHFYLDFLNAIHQKYPSLGILAKSHIGHSPQLSNGEIPGGIGPRISRRAAGLDVQVESAIEIYDKLVREYEGVPGGVRIVLVGHSIGSWIVTQVSQKVRYST
jgi:hypothetical protein